jgi:hemoglobin
MDRQALRSLYEIIGGRQVVEKVVRDFYDYILSDDSLSHHFVGARLEHLQDKFVDYFIYVLGGAEEYTGTNLRRSHTGLQITPEEYNIALKHMRRALRNNNVPIENIAKWDVLMRFFKPHIIER